MDSTAHPQPHDDSSHNPDTTRLPSAWKAVLLVVVSFLVATILSQAIIGIYPLLHHWSDSRTTAWLNNNYSVQFLYTVLAYVLIVQPIIWYMRKHRISWRTIGIRRPQWRDAGWALLTLPIYFLSYILLLSVLSTLIHGLNTQQKQQIGFQGATGVMPLVVTFVSLAVIPPLAEEFVMRGFLFTSLRSKLKLSSAVLITSILFAAGHLQYGSGAPLLWVAAIDTFVLSLFLIYLRVKTGSLWASIMLHALKNTVAFITIFILHSS